MLQKQGIKKETMSRDQSGYFIFDNLILSSVILEITNLGQLFQRDFASLVGDHNIFSTFSHF